MSLAKISGTLYALLGVFIGIIFSLVSLVGLTTMPEDEPAAIGMLFGIGALLWAPILYGVLGFLMSLVGAALYNLLARWVGGIELQLE